MGARRGCGDGVRRMEKGVGGGCRWKWGGVREAGATEANMLRAPDLGLWIRIILGENALSGISRTPIAIKSNFCDKDHNPVMYCLNLLFV